MHLVSFFELIQHIFKLPASVDLSYKGFEVSFPTASIPCNDTPVLDVLSDKDGAHDRTFEIMPALSNAVLHQYIRSLVRVRMDLAVTQAGENVSSDQAVVELDASITWSPESPHVPRCSVSLRRCTVWYTCERFSTAGAIDSAFRSGPQNRKKTGTGPDHD
jgi:hypothetical protein